MLRCSVKIGRLFSRTDLAVQTGVTRPFLLLALWLYFPPYPLNGAENAPTETASPFTDIPRIDVHAHPANDSQAIGQYVRLRELLWESHAIDLAMWVNLGNRNQPQPELTAVAQASGDRMLCAIADYTAHDGLRFPPEELGRWLRDGYVGYKIWSGPPSRRLKPGERGFPYIDDPAHEPTFARMEKLGMLCASLHVADPNGPWGRRTRWLSDPVEYWRQITAWRHVLERHPKLKAVCAHGMWAMCQDAQIDYLRNMLATFPNLAVDLAATFQYFNLVKTENLRAFMIEYADRILFGTDIGRWTDPEETAGYVERYLRCFRILETDQVVKGTFFSEEEIQGLALPRDVLEKIYFRNALRIYPGAQVKMRELGYPVP